MRGAAALRLAAAAPVTALSRSPAGLPAAVGAKRGITGLAAPRGGAGDERQRALCLEWHLLALHRRLGVLGGGDSLRGQAAARVEEDQVLGPHKGARAGLVGALVGPGVGA